LRPLWLRPTRPAGTGVAHVRRPLVAHLTSGLTLGPVVRGKHEDRVVVELEFLERVEDLPDVVVAFHQFVTVLSDSRFARERIGREIWKMPHRKWQVEEPASWLRFMKSMDFAVSSLSISDRTCRVYGLTVRSGPPSPRFDDLRPLR
jgi:hypothetical protein